MSSSAGLGVLSFLARVVAAMAAAEALVVSAVVATARGAFTALFLRPHPSRRSRRRQLLWQA